MPIVRTKLELFKDVTAGNTDATQNHAPAIGDFKICLIEAEAAFDLNCAVEVMFDGNLLWMTKGSSKRTEPIELTSVLGTELVELILDATDLPTGSVYLGGLVKIEQES